MPISIIFGSGREGRTLHQRGSAPRSYRDEYQFGDFISWWWLTDMIADVAIGTGAFEVREITG